MPAVRDKPGLRESIDLLEALVQTDAPELTAEVIDTYLCFLGKRQKDLLNLRQGIARLEFAVRAPDDEIDTWVEWACNTQETTMLDAIDGNFRGAATIGLS
jgi:hypothetical protein